MKFKKQKSRMGTITYICDNPFVAIRESGTIKATSSLGCCLAWISSFLLKLSERAG